MLIICLNFSLGVGTTDNSVNLDTEEGNITNEASNVRNLSLPPEMECEVGKLKGDAIGDTLYSERWVLRQLMVLLEVSVCLSTLTHDGLQLLLFLLCSLPQRKCQKLLKMTCAYYGI